jgi:hypothetical protein
MRLARGVLKFILIAGSTTLLFGQYGRGGAGRDYLGGHPYPIRTDIPAPVGLNPPAAAYTGILPGAFNSSGKSGRGSRGYGFVAPLFPFSNVGYLPSYATPAYAPDMPVDANASAMVAAQQAMADQIARISAQLEEMKTSQGQAPPAPTISAAPESKGSEAPPADIPLRVVLRNGQQLTVRSYAIMNGMLWDLSKQPVRKIPVTNIDIAASTKATEESGGEFPQIKPGQ